MNERDVAELLGALRRIADALEFFVADQKRINQENARVPNPVPLQPLLHRWPAVRPLPPIP